MTLEPAPKPSTLPDLPRPLERYDICHPDVPPSWEGATILHLTDLHVRRGRPWTPVLRELMRVLPQIEVDLVVLTGDYPDKPRDEAAALDVIRQLAGAWRCRKGAFGIWGNHDSAGIVSRCAEVPGVRWLDGGGVDLGGGLAVAGTSFPEDTLALVYALESRHISPQTHFVLALAHYPTEGYSLAAMGVQLVLAGHTHGGQIRLSPSRAPHTSGDMPSDLASGLFATGNTLVAVSRGLGNAVVPFRMNCPPQAVVYRLVRGALDGSRGSDDKGVAPLRAIVRW